MGLFTNPTRWTNIYISQTSQNVFTLLYIIWDYFLIFSLIVLKTLLVLSAILKTCNKSNLTVLYLNNLNSRLTVNIVDISIENWNSQLFIMKRNWFSIVFTKFSDNVFKSL